MCVRRWGWNTVVIDGTSAVVVVSVCKTMGAEHCCIDSAAAVVVVSVCKRMGVEHCCY